MKEIVAGTVDLTPLRQHISTSAVVTNNVLYRAGWAAIHLWHDANDVVISNNTVSWSTFGIVIGGGAYYWRTVGADNTRT